jgi:hypothetical protein
MPFRQGDKPSLIVPKRLLGTFRNDLRGLGYVQHQTFRMTRENETMAWTKPIGRGRQVHVQEEPEDGSILVFAHTEPEGTGIRHMISALFDHANFSAGSRVLRADLRSMGWDV